MFELSAAVRAGDGGAALALIDRLYNASKDMERLCAEWTEYFRNLMILKSVKDAADLIVAPPAELQRMAAEAEQFDLPAILHSMNVLQQALERLRGGVSRRVEMEMAVLRLCSPDLDTSAGSLLRRVKLLEDTIRSGVTLAPAAAPSSPARPAARPDSGEPEAPPPLATRRRRRATARAPIRRFPSRDGTTCWTRCPAPARRCTACWWIPLPCCGGITC